MFVKNEIISRKKVDLSIEKEDKDEGNQSPTIGSELHEGGTHE